MKPRTKGQGTKGQGTKGQGTKGQGTASQPTIALNGAVLHTSVAGRFGTEPATLEIFRNRISGTISLLPSHQGIVLDARGWHALLQALAWPPAEPGGDQGLHPPEAGKETKDHGSLKPLRLRRHPALATVTRHSRTTRGGRR
ncbi:MAG: hypothetical protein HZA93_29295 [Verrucomicrobia bacterium]|nr:hypothetical protein [Verrucomicrobiota bacterium]